MPPSSTRRPGSAHRSAVKRAVRSPTPSHPTAVTKEDQRASRRLGPDNDVRRHRCPSRRLRDRAETTPSRMEAPILIGLVAAEPLRGRSVPERPDQRFPARHGGVTPNCPRCRPRHVLHTRLHRPASCLAWSWLAASPESIRFRGRCTPSSPRSCSGRGSCWLASGSPKCRDSSTWGGLWQRVALIAGLAWILLLARHLARGG